MNFEYTNKINTLIDKINVFMDKFIYPNERVFFEAIESSKSRWNIPPVMEEIKVEAKKVNLNELKHPEKDEDRVKKEEWLVMLGICTHLGCVPLSNKGEYNGWFCPCHGSHYDTSGRIRKGPAPTNMEVPRYEFVNSNTIKIG